MFASELATLRRVGLRSLLVQGLAILSVLTSALCMWKALSLAADTETPVVVVLSGSMEPGFQRGDLLFLSRPSSPYKIGDITVYNVPGSNGQATPIVHRVLEIHDMYVPLTPRFVPQIRKKLTQPPAKGPATSAF